MTRAIWSPLHASVACLANGDGPSVAETHTRTGQGGTR